MSDTNFQAPDPQDSLALAHGCGTGKAKSKPEHSAKPLNTKLLFRLAHGIDVFRTRKGTRANVRRISRHCRLDGGAKVAVSLPEDLYRAVERVRRRNGKTRSAVMQDALRYWLRHQAEIALVREYEEGYRRRPEGRREIDAAMATAIGLLRDEEDW